MTALIIIAVTLWFMCETCSLNSKFEKILQLARKGCCDIPNLSIFELKKEGHNKCLSAFALKQIFDNLRTLTRVWGKITLPWKCKYCAIESDTV